MRTCILGVMALVVFPPANSHAQCDDEIVVDGTSGTDGMALCRRWTDIENQAYVAKCTGGNLTWVDVCDTYGTLTQNVRMNGLGSADALLTVEGGITLAGGCSITCHGMVDLDVYTVTLDGGAGSDVLYSENNTGQLIFLGGDNADVMTLLFGADAGNEFWGGDGADTIVDDGVTWDYLRGEGDNDCIYTSCLTVLDCGDGNNDKEYHWPSWICCAGEEFCPGPVNCEGSATYRCEPL